MDCQGYREWISAETDGELGDGEKEQLHEHLKGCSGCLDEAVWMRRAQTLIDRRARPEVPATIWSRLEPKRAVSGRVPLFLKAAAAAVLAAGFFYAGILFERTGPAVLPVRLAEEPGAGSPSGSVASLADRLSARMVKVVLLPGRYPNSDAGTVWDETIAQEAAHQLGVRRKED